MDNYVVQKLETLHKNCEELMNERKEVIENLAEYGWKLVDEQLRGTGFARAKNRKFDTVTISHNSDDGDWKLFATGWLEKVELFAFIDYIDIRKTLDNM